MAWYDALWDKGTDFLHAVTGVPTADEKRNQGRMINDQIKAYRDQTELTRTEMARKRGEEVAEKRRVEERQIRSLRRNYRSQSLMSTTATPGMTTKLGG